MNKKLLVSVFLCFFVFSLGMLADEKKAKAQIVEFLFRTDLQDDYNAVLWDFEPGDPTVETSFTSHLIDMGHVPPSPGSEALFFELWSGYRYVWNSNPFRRFFVGINLNVSSPLIPARIKVWTTLFRLQHSETNNAENYSVYHERRLINDKVPMTRTKPLWWWVWDTEAQSEVDEEEALSIMNSLIDNGFDIQIQTVGRIQGLDWIYLKYVGMEVTRLSKN